MKRPFAATLDRHAPEVITLPRARNTGFCDIWDLVAPGEPCPTCETKFEDRLREARRP